MSFRVAHPLFHLGNAVQNSHSLSVVVANICFYAFKHLIYLFCCLGKVLSTEIQLVLYYDSATVSASRLWWIPD